jgi:hypothetical protein
LTTRRPTVQWIPKENISGTNPGKNDFEELSEIREFRERQGSRRQATISEEDEADSNHHNTKISSLTVDTTQTIKSTSIGSESKIFQKLETRKSPKKQLDLDRLRELITTQNNESDSTKEKKVISRQSSRTTITESEDGVITILTTEETVIHKTC